MSDVIHEMLECGRSVSKSEWHDEPFKGAITCLECGLPFITIGNSDEVVCVLEFNGGVDVGFASGGKEIGNERQRVAVFLGDLVQTTVINTESEAAIFFLYEEDRRSMWRGGLMDDTEAEVFVNKVAECLEFYLGQLIHWRYQKRSSFFNIYLQVIQTVWS